MELRHVRSFIAVAEELSFTRAAERLHVAQPAVSVQIRQLEQELGAALFDRSRRNIRLTEAGDVLLAEARRLLITIGRTVELVQRTGSGAIGRIVIGFVPSASNEALPSLLRSFKETHPRVALTLRELAPDALLRALRGQEVDVALLYLPFDDPLLKTAVVARESFVVALPRQHALAAEPSIDLSRLADDSWILPAHHGMPGLHAQVLDLCRRAGFTPIAVQDDVWLMQTITSLVAAELGVALVPASVQAQQRRGVVYRPLREPVMQYAELAAAWRADDASPLLAGFLKTLDA